MSSNRNVRFVVTITTQHSIVRKIDHSYEGSCANITQVNTPTSTSDSFPYSVTTHHMILNIGSLSLFEDYSGKDQVIVSNGEDIQITRIGKSIVSFDDKTFLLSDIVLVIKLKSQLLSVQQFVKDNSYFFQFHGDFFLMKDKINKSVLMRGPTKVGMYKLSSMDLQHIQYQIRVNKAAIVTVADEHHLLDILTLIMF